MLFQLVFFIQNTQSKIYLIITILIINNIIIYNIECPTRYRTQHFFSNSNTNEDIATKFEQQYVRVTNEKECVCRVCL